MLNIVSSVVCFFVFYTLGRPTGAEISNILFDPLITEVIVLINFQFAVGVMRRLSSNRGLFPFGFQPCSGCVPWSSPSALGCFLCDAGSGPRQTLMSSRAPSTSADKANSRYGYNQRLHWPTYPTYSGRRRQLLV